MPPQPPQRRRSLQLINKGRYALIERGGWGEGVALPFINLDERERDTLTPTPHATSAESPLLTSWRYRRRLRGLQQLREILLPHGGPGVRAVAMGLVGGGY
jgi:hypothetical protein